MAIKNADTPATLAETAYGHLRDAIVGNELGPGYQASEREICERYELGRTPVREAILRLRDEGLVEVLPRKGFRVLPLRPEDVREIHQLAKALETEAALILAGRPLAGTDAEAIEVTVRAMEAAGELEDREAWVLADTGFHTAVVARSGNARLHQSYLDLRTLTDRARRFALHLRPFPHQSTREHRAMLDAMRAGELERVFHAYRDHWHRTTEELIALIHRHNRSYF